MFIIDKLNRSVSETSYFLSLILTISLVTPSIVLTIKIKRTSGMNLMKHPNKAPTSAIKALVPKKTKSRKFSQLRLFLCANDLYEDC